MSSIWSTDDSKTILLTKQGTRKSTNTFRMLAFGATVFGLLLITFVVFQESIFSSSSAKFASKAPVDDCVSAIQPKVAAGEACPTGDFECGCAVILSITDTDLAACPANLTDPATAQAATDLYTGAVACCSGPVKSACADSNFAFYQILQASLGGSSNVTLPGNVTIGINGTSTGTINPTPTPTPSQSGALRIVPAAFLLTLLL